MLSFSRVETVTFPHRLLKYDDRQRGSTRLTAVGSIMALRGRGALAALAERSSSDGGAVLVYGFPGSVVKRPSHSHG
jgi:hypothetical protein